MRPDGWTWPRSAPGHPPTTCPERTRPCAPTAGP